ncbi:PKD domain-containing protein, partial [Luteibaculum oceani]|uniref:PKD domain-containing protein n=1 Tax=Luteibaculum oceani TaxID=1294296 RepID=UPI001476B6B2
MSSLYRQLTVLLIIFLNYLPSGQCQNWAGKNFLIPYYSNPGERFGDAVLNHLTLKITSAYCLDSIKITYPDGNFEYLKITASKDNFHIINPAFFLDHPRPFRIRTHRSAILIESPKDIAVHAFARELNYSVLPLSFSDTLFAINHTSIWETSPGHTFKNRTDLIEIISTEDNNEITYREFNGTDFSTIRETIDKYESLIINNSIPTSLKHPNESVKATTLSQNIVSSTKPVVVFTTKAATKEYEIPDSCDYTFNSCRRLLESYYDQPNLIQQIPVSKWGKKYLTGQIRDRKDILDNDPYSCDEGTIIKSNLENHYDYLEIIGLQDDLVSITTIDSSWQVALAGLTDPSPFGTARIQLYGKNGGLISISSENSFQVNQFSFSGLIDSTFFSRKVSLSNNLCSYPKFSNYYFNIFPVSDFKSNYLNTLENTGSWTLDIKGSQGGNSSNGNFFKVLIDSNFKSGFLLNGKDISINWLDEGIDGYASGFLKVEQVKDAWIRNKNNIPFGLFSFNYQRDFESSIHNGGYYLDSEVSICEQCGSCNIQTIKNICLGDTAFFTSQVDVPYLPDEVNYLWDFGDGNISTSESPFHLYGDTGVYNVSLTVTDFSGCSLGSSFLLFVGNLTNKISFTDSICGITDVSVAPNTINSPDTLHRVYRSTNESPLPIPDVGISFDWDGTESETDSFLVSSINITQQYILPGTIDSICININHGEISDLHLILKSPDNLVYVLKEPNNFYLGPDFRNTCFSNIPRSTFAGSDAPFTGNFQTEFGDFPTGGIGSDITGEWKLLIGDKIATDIGELLNWSIYVSSANFVDYSWSNNTNLVSPPNGQGESVIRVSEQDTFLLTSTSLAGCSRVDTIAPFVGRNPVALSHQDTLLCNIYEDFDLNQLITDSLKLTNGVWTILNGNPANLSGSLFDNRGIPAGDYQFLYTQDIFCGKDSAVVNVTVTELPFLGQNAIDTLCDTENPLDLFPYLGNDVTSGGFWTNYDGVPEAAFAGNTGIVDPRKVNEGNYFFYYKVPVAGCPADSSNVNLQINHQPDAGSNGDTIICESGIPLTLLTVLNNNPETGGTWTDLDNSGGLDGQLFRGINTPNNPNEQTFTFDYTIKGKKACIDSSALATVRVIAAPELTFSADFPILCKDSAVTITATMVGNGPFDLEISDGNGNTYPALNELPVINSYQFSQPLSDITTFSVTRMIDNSSLRCPIVKPAAIEVGVFEPIVAKLIEEDCILNPDGISFLGFTPVIELSGGDGTNYKYDLFVDGNLVKSGAPAPSAVHRLDTLPNGVEYSYRFYDGSNCPDVEAVFNRRPRKYCECATFAGTMDINPLEFCEYETAVVPNVSNSFLEPEDTLYYILHDRAGIVLGERLDSNQFPSFDYFPALEFNKTYYISPIAGDRLGGGIDPIDTCVSVGDGTPIIFRPQPAVNFSSLGGDICEGDIFELGFEFTGNGPFRLQGTATNSKGTSVLDYSFLPDSGSLPLNPLENTVYRFTRLSDGNVNTCELNFDTPIAVNVFDLPRVSITDPDEINICEGSSTQINVAITGGTGPYRIEFLKNGTPFGNPVVTNNNSFQLNVFEGGLYQINAIRDEGANCGGLVLDGSVRVVVKKQPFANAGPSPIEVCGSFTQLDATPSFGKGAWRLPSDGSFTFSNNKQSKTFAFVPEPGEYQFIWEETNAPCPV